MRYHHFPLWFFFGRFEGPKLTSFSRFYGKNLTSKNDVPPTLLGADLVFFQNTVEGWLFKKATHVDAMWSTKDQTFKIGLSWTPSEWTVFAEWFDHTLFRLTFNPELSFGEVLKGCAQPLTKALLETPTELPVAFFNSPNNKLTDVEDLGVELLIPLEARQIHDAYERFNLLEKEVSAGWIRGDVVLHSSYRYFQIKEEAREAYLNIDTGFPMPDPPESEEGGTTRLPSFVYVLHLRVPLTLLTQVWEAYETLHQDTVATLGDPLLFMSAHTLAETVTTHSFKEKGIRQIWMPLPEDFRDALRLGETHPKAECNLKEEFAFLDLALTEQAAARFTAQTAKINPTCEESQQEECSSVEGSVQNDTAYGIPLTDIVQAVNAYLGLSARVENNSVIVTNTRAKKTLTTVITVRAPTPEDTMPETLQGVLTIKTDFDGLPEQIGPEAINLFAVGGAFYKTAGKHYFGSRISVPASALSDNGGTLWRDVFVPLVAASVRYVQAPIVAFFKTLSTDDTPQTVSIPWTERDFNRLRDTWHQLFTHCTTGEDGLTGEFALASGDTALWQIHAESNPALGAGLVITLMLPTRYESEAICAQKADHLNQRELAIGTAFPHFGAWTQNRHFLTYACFLPKAMHDYPSIFFNLPLYAMLRARWAEMELKKVDALN